jgi:hypothetical protein
MVITFICFYIKVISNILIIKHKFLYFYDNISDNFDKWKLPLDKKVITLYHLKNYKWRC